jgi:fermentation-respiration switch protein FrsA (DUF1100 family)
MLGVLSAVVLASYGVFVTLLFLLQRRILFRTGAAAPDLAQVGVTGVAGITVTTADGLALQAWYMPPPREGSPVVLFLHGNAGNIGHRAWRLALFRELGWGVMLLEYRGYGGNPGRASEAGLTIDAHAGLATLQNMGFPPSAILLWGESLGSGLAVRLAAEREVGAVLLEAPYTSIADVARLRYPFVPVNWLLRDRFDSLRILGKVRAPVLVMHGAHDKVIPVAMGRAVYAAAAEPKELWIAPSAGHLDLVEAGAMAAAGQFVARLHPS